MTLGCIIQARMGSSRLPGKVLIKLDKKNTALDYVINQLNKSKFIEKKVIATTYKREDIEIIKKAKNLGINYFRGKSNDLLDRYYKCSKKFSFDPIIRITSDCPFIDPKIIDDMIKNYQKNNYDYISNYFPKTFPIGMGIEIFSKNILEFAWKNSYLPFEREHISPFYFNNKKRLKFYNVKSKTNYSHIRITLDRKNDLKLLRHLVKAIKPRPILLNHIIYYYKKNPKIFEINKKYNNENPF